LIFDIFFRYNISTFKNIGGKLKRHFVLVKFRVRLENNFTNLGSEWKTIFPKRIFTIISVAIKTINNMKYFKMDKNV
jgi:hypothetical protein